jgi:hypothetical protein
VTARLGRLRLRNVPSRMRALSAVVLVALAVLSAVTGFAIWDGRKALRTVGQDEGPMVVAANDLYLALSDMDAQVTNVLLTGGEDTWICGADTDGSCGSGPSRRYYDVRREDAQRAALQAARLTEDDPVRLRTVQSVLDGMHQYDQRVQAAMERGRATGHAFGPLPPDAVREYRAANGLMAEDLLPKANNLTLGGAALVDSTYRDERAGVLSGRARVLASGLAVFAVLLLLQLYVGVRFRRAVNPFLAAATLGTAALIVAAASLFATEADQLKAAKDGGFDPLLALSRTRAIGKSLDADRNRYLLDPGGADRYDESYLEKSQAIVYIADAYDLETYYAKLEQRLARYDGSSHAVTFGGYYGARAREVATPGRRRTVEALLSRYLAYQLNDQRVRRLAESGKRADAVRAHLDPDWTYLPHRTFREHDEALDSRIDRDQYVVEHAVMDGERALSPWPWLLPVSALAVAALVAAGVRPRLSEYR